MENFVTFMEIESESLITYISGHNKYTQKLMVDTNWGDKMILTLLW